MFKNMKLVILFFMLLSPSFKMTSFANIARTTASKDLLGKIWNWVFISKIIFNFE